MKLNELQIGSTATILSVGGEGALRQHFLDMGLIQGTEVTVVQYAPMGDPIELRLHGYELTIRLKDAKNIEISKEHKPKNIRKKVEKQEKLHPGYGEGGNVTDKPEILFQRLDLEEVMKKVEELHPPVEEEKEEEGIDIEAKEEITFDDFMKMQFQVGEIIACEEVKKSKKLLCSQVKIGSQVKQIVSGIKGHYTAEEMVGKKVMVLVNLKPAKLAGVLSEGMLLCAEDAEGNLALMTPEKTMPAGAEIC